MVKEFGVDRAFNSDEINRKKVEELSFDQLTGLPGGELLFSRLEDLVKKLNSRENTLKKIIVIALDMNRLKFFNDTYGHFEGGNKALTAFAGHLKAIIKDVDLVFRPNKGGDEFTILIRSSKEDIDSNQIFERIKKAVNTGLSVDFVGASFPITAAMGYVVIEKGTSKTTTEILHEADLKMYEDKERVRQVEKTSKEEREKTTIETEDYSI